jgi:hypothetical protein
MTFDSLQCRAEMGSPKHFFRFAEISRRMAPDLLCELLDTSGLSEYAGRYLINTEDDSVWCKGEFPRAIFRY